MLGKSLVFGLEIDKQVAFSHEYSKHQLGTFLITVVCFVLNYLPVCFTYGYVVCLILEKPAVHSVLSPSSVLTLITSLDGLLHLRV